EVHHPDGEVERPHLGRLLDRAALEGLDPQLDPDLVDCRLSAEHAAERAWTAACPRPDQLAGALPRDRVGLPDGHGTGRIHRMNPPADGSQGHRLGRRTAASDNLGEMTDQLTMRLEPRLPKLPSGLPAVLDGEVVVVDADGRLDRDELARRLSGATGRPLSFLAFDLLHLDGRSLLGLPLDRRRQLLRQVLRPGDEVVAVPSIVTEGRALFEAVTGQGLYGIRARQHASPYLPGVRSRLWRTVAVAGSAGVVPTGLPGGNGAEGSGETDDALEPATGDSEPVLALIR